MSTFFFGFYLHGFNFSLFYLYFYVHWQFIFTSLKVLFIIIFFNYQGSVCRQEGKKDYNHENFPFIKVKLNILDQFLFWE